MEFQKFNKIPRLSRDIIITEKLDGSNAQVCINYYNSMNQDNIDFIAKYCLNRPDSYATDGFSFHCDQPFIFAGSRNRWLFIDNGKNCDNHGFAQWVTENLEELIKLGEGRHYGEWFGKGIQRNYGLDEKRFALFNVKKWHIYGEKPRLISIDQKTKEEKYTKSSPKCCEVVPILYEGVFDTNVIDEVLDGLEVQGSCAVPGFMNPEGIVIFHKASGQLFKKTIEGDEKPKGQNDR